MSGDRLRPSAARLRSQDTQDWPQEAVLVGGLGIDLGTANTVVCHTTRGIVLNEPSVMLLRADRSRRSRPLSVGAEARALMGRTPGGVSAVRPLQDGVVVDLE